MRVITATEAKTHLLQLLDAVERGETLVVTRHGRPIARIVHDVERHQEEIDAAMSLIVALRRRTGRIAAAELLAAREEVRG